ncbi:MAG: 2-amino-4-hydroxy-6-hydroxymethyldihydropteridine diphosphokinase [Gammaproteobacteria bacterium]|nr:MAG: 2-amino-4-hydroxy-6-hydroxymethyldihydropteridine diphosphokinase [Gammaproteobacteria bacterium]TND06362.1 MAG: 2-amino-4-hydroxy-6-hydroxymethyldihydropteridine diphosphokinase [Gammaproteobacteria bacterium]
MTLVYVSIGSNIDRVANIRTAVDALRQHYGELTVSSVYESAPVGFTGENFYNLVVGFDTEDTVDSVAAFLHNVENRQRRDRAAPRFSARTIDLDLLLFGDLVLASDTVQVPRDDITDYAFVLAPLTEIAANERHPVTGRRFAELWHEFNKAKQPLWAVDVPLS